MLSIQKLNIVSFALNVDLCLINHLSVCVFVFKYMEYFGLIHSKENPKV